MTIFLHKDGEQYKITHYSMHSFSTSTNLCQCTAVLNVDAPNCYITLHA